jgi:hypothetical protein
VRSLENQQASGRDSDPDGVVITQLPRRKVGPKTGNVGADLFLDVLGESLERDRILERLSMS